MILRANWRHLPAPTAIMLGGAVAAFWAIGRERQMLAGISGEEARVMGALLLAGLAGLVPHHHDGSGTRLQRRSALRTIFPRSRKLAGAVR